MNKWEYVSLQLVWLGDDKKVKVTQFGQSKHYTLLSKKEWFNQSYIDKFNLIIGKLGAAGWELVSVTTLHGSTPQSGGHYSTDAHSQEYWFKRQQTEEKLPTVEDTLFYVFKEHKPTTSGNLDSHFDYYGS